MVVIAMNEASTSEVIETPEPIAALPEELRHREAAHLERVKQQLKRKADPPLRHLTMPDLGGVTKMTLAEFDTLRRRMVECKELYAIPKSPKTATLTESIQRACYLLFSLVESGGLCMTHPEREVERIRIDSSGALGGYIRWAKREQQDSSEAGKEKSADAVAHNEETTSEHGFAGSRQHLYILGHTHLTAFIHYRITKDGARDGDLLLPALPQQVSELKRMVVGTLPWMKHFKGKVEWRRIFRFWLNAQLTDMRGRASEASWTCIVHLALWRILQRERRALLLAARQNLIATSPMPDDKINDLLAYREIRYRKVSCKERDPVDGTSVKPRSHSSRAEPLHLEAEGAEDALLDLVEEAKENPIESKRDTDRQHVSKFLATLRIDDAKKVEIVKAAKALADSSELNCGIDDDVRYLLHWICVLLRKRKAISTAHTYASRVLRAMHAFDDKPLSICTTGDIAAYLENYESPNSVRNTRSTLQDFDDYLIESKGAARGRINWKDKSLLAYEQYRERDCITEDEYRRVRETIANTSLDERLCLRRLSMLTLLRRCGLRADEVAWLTTDNFLGWTQWRLLVIRSKTRAGRKRTLPLYLLLSGDEQQELRRYIALCKDGDAKITYLFTDAEGARLRSHALGREVERLLRSGGVQGETAHGLRHAFATGTFAAWWLDMTRSSVDASAQDGSWSRRALEMYGRPRVESRAVSHAYHIQLLLGHADLRVTFDRYVHVIDLACADAVWMADNRDGGECGDSVRLIYAARLMGMDDKELRSAVPKSQRQNAELNLPIIRTLLRGRLRNISDG